MTKRIYNTVQERVVGALWNHGDLTQKQLRAMYRVGSPSKEVQRLREIGVPIYTINTKCKQGKRIMKYRLGKVSIDVVRMIFGGCKA